MNINNYEVNQVVLTIITLVPDVVGIFTEAMKKIPGTWFAGVDLACFPLHSCNLGNRDEVYIYTAGATICMLTVPLSTCMVLHNV